LKSLLVLSGVTDQADAWSGPLSPILSPHLLVRVSVSAWSWWLLLLGADMCYCATFAVAWSLAEVPVGRVGAVELRARGPYARFR